MIGGIEEIDIGPPHDEERRRSSLKKVFHSMPRRRSLTGNMIIVAALFMHASDVRLGLVPLGDCSTIFAEIWSYVEHYVTRCEESGLSRMPTHDPARE